MLSKSILPLISLVHLTFGESKVTEANSLVCADSTFSTTNFGLDARVLSISAVPQHNYNVPWAGPTFPATSGLSFCQVKIYLNHPGTDDKVLVEVWLPLAHDDWNGRFQATGGRGFATGTFDPLLGPAIKGGWAAVSTDGGHDGDGAHSNEISWALNADQTVNWNLLENFATRSLVEQIIIGKIVTEKYYGTAPHHSYWNGCSQGGRQGYVIAQNYPQLVDGILADAPAISLAHLVMGDLWPQVVMREAGTYMTQCELAYFQRKAIEACDLLDGVRDGVIEDPEACDFNPATLVGEKFSCDGNEVQATDSMAELVGKIQQGPHTPFGNRVWYGLPYGTTMHKLAGTNVSPEGLRSPRPFAISENYIHSLLLKGRPSNDSALTLTDYFALWAQSSYEFGWILNADNPDLTALRAAGTKLLTWHGITDDLIPYQNTVQYREWVEKTMGGAQEVNNFYRLFLAPGVEHCGSGVGPVPKDPLDALVEWVEKGEAPEVLAAETMNAEGELISRDLCAWPGKSKYMGIGDANRASSWSCEGGTPLVGYEFEADIDQKHFAPLGKDYDQGVLKESSRGHKERKEGDPKAAGRAAAILDGLKNRLGDLDMNLRIG